jgi:4'-phosphopantetheinyl transferase
VTDLVWALRRATDVPDDDVWLTADEQRVQQRLVVPKRRADWRLGRWTAKAALHGGLGLAPADVAVMAADDGAPEVIGPSGPLPVSLSISHREGTGVAAVGLDGTVVGIDLEVVEPRSDAFVREWLADDEQALVARARAADRHDEVACLVWSAKEAAAKLRRAGLRMNVRAAVVSFDDDPVTATSRPARWRTWQVHVTDGPAEDMIAGWWHLDGAWLVCLATSPDRASPPPPCR